MIREPRRRESEIRDLGDGNRSGDEEQRGSPPRKVSRLVIKVRKV